MKHIYAIIKPKGPTSFDMIARLRKITGIKKIGHAGTLDPLASGILVVGITREGTRELGKIEKTEKEYIAKIKLGETSTTDDEEGDKIIIEYDSKITRTEINRVLKCFIGVIKQVPPVYSAIKINGKPACRRVRAGQKVVMKARIIEIKNIELISYRWPYLEIQVTCGPGTYIRSLARDIGEKLGTGGYLANLKRTRVGDYHINNAYDLDRFEKFWKDKAN